jgi:hypothetical protein
VYWYGLETVDVIVTLALAASSPEFDAQTAGVSAGELAQVALKGLRYLCFTHDTGPADCVRPQKSWGRSEPAGTKWGERGRGFFPESQCGFTIANLVLTAMLIPDRLGDEERRMLCAIAIDYMDRFGEMAPKSGVYYDTQIEENAWTALGMVACLLLLGDAKGGSGQLGATMQPTFTGRPGCNTADAAQLSRWWEQVKLWMFRTATMPRDATNQAEFADGKSVRELCGRTFTTLPDGTAENHGFVHPSYMASAVILSGMAINLLRLRNWTVPPHIFWHRRDIYALLKQWCDNTGAPQAVQGMDWPYFNYPGLCFYHAIANLYFKDPDAALLERIALDVVQRASAAHKGRMVPEEAATRGHGPQDPALLRERAAASLGLAYLAHRMMGLGEAPSDAPDFERRMRGVAVYAHGGVLLHRHTRGQTSLAWRNRTMVLPFTRDGQTLFGPASGSMLAKIQVQGCAPSTTPVALKIRERHDSVSVLLVQDLAQDSVRRSVFFVSLPNGKCLIAERLVAQQRIVVERVEQGYLSVVNDGYFGQRQTLRGQRQLFWPGGQRTFDGHISLEADIVVDLDRVTWVNVDDRCGFVFEGSGRTFYRNRHSFDVFRAVEDDLVLSLNDTPQVCQAGQQVAQLITLCCPEQTHRQTADQTLIVRPAPAHVLALEVDGFLCAGNLSPSQVHLVVHGDQHGGADRLALGGWESTIRELV